MSSPIHHAKDIDTALLYAPPWARDPGRSAPVGPAADSAGAVPHRIRGKVDRFSGDRAMSELQRQFTLNPEKVPEPPLDTATTLWPFVQRLCAFSGIAALVAWGIVALPNIIRRVGNPPALADVSPVKVDVPPAQADVVPAAAVAKPVKLVRVESKATPRAPLVPDALTKDADAPATAGGAPDAAAQPHSPVLDSQADAAVPAPQAAAPIPVSKPPVLDGDEIAMLVKRGKDFLTNGDLSSARLLLRRAAEAGSAEAALALGASFDPAVIHRLGAIGAEPDIARARKWYQTAAKLGSEAASQQLAKLAQADQ